MVYRLVFRLTDGAWYDGQKVTRTFDVPGSCSLEDICSHLLMSLDFDFDHMYMFSKDSQEWEGAPPYRGAPRSERCLIHLGSLKLQKGDTFLLVYDFGDDWTFVIKVKDVLNSNVSSIQLVDSKGEIEQYPDEEDWDDPFDEDLEEEPLAWNYSAPDQLYEAAFRYKKAKLWNKLMEAQVFAVQFSDGEIGYVSVMGKIHEHCALSVWCGDIGLKALRRMLLFDFDLNSYSEHEIAFCQDCLQMVLDNQEYLNDEELADVKAYAKAHGIRFAGQNAYPHFYRFTPYHHPWHLNGEQDEQHMLEALEAAVQMAECLKNKRIVLHDLMGFETEIPLMKKQSGTYQPAELLSVPDYEFFSFPLITGFDKKLAANVKKLPKNGTYECRLEMLASPVNGQDGAPVYPMLFLAIERDTEMALPPCLEMNYHEHPENVVDSFLSTLKETGSCPKEILVRDMRTYQLLASLCASLKTKIESVASLPHVDDLLDQLMDENGELLSPYEAEEPFSDEDDFLEEMIERLLNMPASEIRQFPPVVLQSIHHILDSGMIPEEDAEKIKKKMKW